MENMRLYDEDIITNYDDDNSGQKAGADMKDENMKKEGEE